MNKMNTYIYNVYKDAVVMALVAVLAIGCTNADNAVEPGTATPEGGNTPGVEIELINPVITIPAVAADVQTGARSVTLTSASLKVDLMDKNGKVTASGSFQNLGPGWTVNKPIAVRGGEGTYYMRAAASIMTDSNIGMIVSYSGTAMVSADGTFVPDAPLTPFDAQIKVTVRDADGNAVMPDNSTKYHIFSRGVAFTGYSTDWTGTSPSSRPIYSAANSYRIGEIANGAACLMTLMPGTVPEKWNSNSGAYSQDGTYGSNDILFTIYKGLSGASSDLDSTTGLPVAGKFNKSWDVKPSKKLTIEAGKQYNITVTINGADIHITSITTANLDFTDAIGDDNVITIK